MTIDDIIKHHQKKLNYHTESNKNFRSMRNWQKTGGYKALYDYEVSRHRKMIKFHTEVINTLERVVNNGC